MSLELEPGDAHEQSGNDANELECGMHPIVEVLPVVSESSQLGEKQGALISGQLVHYASLAGG